MRESRLYGSVRGVLGNWHSYRDSLKPKKKPPERIPYQNGNHVSTAKLLAQK
jgi:hypothetical protein